MPTRKPSEKRVAKKSAKSLKKEMNSVASKRKRTTVSKMPTKTATKITRTAPAERTIQAPESIAKKRVINAAEKAADKIKGKDYISLMRTEQAYNNGASAEAKKLGYKTAGSMSRYGSKLKKSKPAQRKVTGVESKTVGKPSTSTTTTKIKYKRRK